MIPDRDGAMVPSGSATGVLPAYAAATDPGASNDVTQGYGAGALAINTGTGRVFVCRSAAQGAAVWEVVGDPTLFVAGNWYFIPGLDLLAAGSSQSTTNLYLYPFRLPHRCTIGSLGIRVTTPGTTTLQLALYRNISGANALPGALIDKTAQLASTSATVVTGALGANQQLEKGAYWAAVQAGDSTCVWQSCNSAVSATMAETIGDPTVANVSQGTANALGMYQTPNAFASGPPATLAAATLTGGNSSRTPAFLFNVATVP